MFVLHHPADMGNTQNAKEPEKITYDMAQEEIVQNSGFDMDTGGKSKGKSGHVVEIRWQAFYFEV